MKKCRDCHKRKSLSEFYTHPRAADGHLNKCKECVKARVTKHRLENVDRVREYDRARSMLPHRVEARRRYFEWYCERRKLERAAQIIANNAVRRGRLKKGPCEICGNKKVHGHHPDYTQPLKVRWLCVPHHKAVHMGKIE